MRSGDIQGGRYPINMDTYRSGVFARDQLSEVAAAAAADDGAEYVSEQQFDIISQQISEGFSTLRVRLSPFLFALFVIFLVAIVLISLAISGVILGKGHAAGNELSHALYDLQFGMEALNLKMDAIASLHAPMPPLTREEWDKDVTSTSTSTSISTSTVHGDATASPVKSVSSKSSGKKSSSGEVI